MKLGEFCVMIIVMIVFLQFLGLPTGLSVIPESYGININEDSGQLTNADVGNSYYYLKIFGAVTGFLIVLAGGGAVIVGLFAKSYDTSLIILPLVVATAGTFITTFWAIILHVQNLGQPWATNLITIIMGGIGVAFIWSCVDYFAGR